MDWLQAVVLGVVQGLTEFLPVSSTAHLVLVPWWLGWPDPGLGFDVALHLGTLLAVCVWFRRELRGLGRALGALLCGGVRRVQGRRAAAERRLLLVLAVGTLPVVLAGLAGRHAVASTLRSPVVIGVALIAVALAILAIERAGQGRRRLAQVGLGTALLVGLAQALALVPGVSRSGATIAMALALGLRRTEAVRLSFLLGVPAIAGAVMLEASALWRDGFGAAGPLAFAAGTLAAAVSGYLAIGGLLAWVRAHTFTAFMLYRVAVGALTLWLAARGAVLPL